MGAGEDPARSRAAEKFGNKAPDFTAAIEGGHPFILQEQRKIPQNPAQINAKLRDTESAPLIPEGLPNRPWYRHAIYAPGQYTGYAAVVIPGVNEAIDRGDLRRTEE